LSFFDELKRRNVFRVGIAYGVAAWVLLQVVDLVLDNVEAPDWVMDVFMLVVVLGFVVSIIIAWAYEITPEGIKREQDVDRSQSITGDTAHKLDRIIIGFLAGAVVLLLTDRFFSSPEMGSEPFSQSTAEQTENGINEKRDPTPAVLDPVIETSSKSIAVLPFANMSEDAGNEFFADGISEEILNALAKVKELKVAGRTSAFAFKGQNQDLREIGEALGVNHILEGSVRKAGNKVRVTAQLIQVSDGFHLWSDTYDRELTDIFAIQDEIANAILAAMKAELIGGQSIASTQVDPVVYEKYLLAKQHIYTRNQFNLESAAELLREATDIDPGFASAWGQLGIATLLLADDSYGTIPRADAQSISRVYLEKALEIDESNAEALAGMGFLHNRAPGGRSTSITAIDYLERALAINPAMNDASNWLQQAYGAVDRDSDALRILEEMFNRDPLYKPGAGNLIFAYTNLGRTEMAERVLERVRPFLRDQAFISRTHAAILNSSGQFGEGLAKARISFELDPNDATAYASLAWSMSSLGMDNELVEMDAPFPFFRLNSLIRLDRNEEGLKYARDWSDQLGDPSIMINFYHAARKPEALANYLDSRWPELADLKAELVGGGGFGDFAMIQVAYAYKLTGNLDKFEQARTWARAEHDRQAKEGFDSMYFHNAESSYWAMIGNKGRSLAYMETAFDKGLSFPISQLAYAPEFDELRNDERFQALALRPGANRAGKITMNLPAATCRSDRWSRTGSVHAVCSFATIGRSHAKLKFGASIEFI
jgi:TolB-like protein